MDLNCWLTLFVTSDVRNITYKIPTFRDKPQEFSMAPQPDDSTYSISGESFVRCAGGSIERVTFQMSVCDGEAFIQLDDDEPLVSTRHDVIAFIRDLMLRLRVIALPADLPAPRTARSSTP